MGLTADVTGQQRMLTPPWHLILPSLLSRVRVALPSTLYMCVFWIMITFNTLLTSPIDIYLDISMYNQSY